MTASQSPHPSRIVLVVGVDMSHISEHLLAQTRVLVQPVDEAEVHVVHVVRPEAPLLRVARPSDEKDAGVVHQVELAQGAVQRLCEALVHTPRTRVVMHTPVGDPADELVRIAAEVNADVLVVEAHEPDEHRPAGMFHHSTLDHIASTAPCTVLTLRKGHGVPLERPTLREAPGAAGRWTASS